MRNFILTQLKLYQAGNTSINIEKLKILAQQYLSISEYDKYFGNL
jgi:hypothetical protein